MSRVYNKPCSQNQKNDDDRETNVILQALKGIMPACSI
jgi:hypothetical protein